MLEVGFLLVLWVNSNGNPLFQTPVLQAFATQQQCQTAGKHIQGESTQVRSFECLAI